MAGFSSRPGLRLRRRRAHPSARARLLSLPIVFERSRWLGKLLRGLVTTIIVSGLVLTTLGLAVGLRGFTANLSNLVQYAGGGDSILSSSLALFQFDVLNLLGVTSSDSVDQGGTTPEEVAQVPDTGPGGPIYSAETPSGAGLTPYQVEVDVPTQQAPPLPTSIPATANPSTATPPAATLSAASPDNPTATVPPAPTPTPEPPAVPGWISIPSIGLDAPIIVSHTKMVVVDGKTFAQWEAPNMLAAGWQEGSALLGEPGNTVLNGHHNIDGEVFGHLYQLNQGDEIIVYSGQRAFHYAVSQVMKLEERNAPLEQRQENARWVLPSADERLTLVTCWPPTSNTYRLIVVAVPIK